MVTTKRNEQRHAPHQRPGHRSGALSQSASAARAQGVLDRAGQVARDGVEVDLGPQPFGKRGRRELAVVAGAVEAAVDGALHTPANRLEEREGGERGRRDCQGLALGDAGQQRLEPDDEPGEDDDQDTA